MGLVYIANSSDVESALTLIERLLELGHVPVCPQVTFAGVPKANSTLAGFVWDHSLEPLYDLIAVCDAVVVPKSFQGQDQTLVAFEEVEFARECGIPIHKHDDLPPLTVAAVASPKTFQEFRILTGKMYRQVVRKNADYGPGNIALTGELGVVVRLGDKICRLLNLFGFKFTVEKSTFAGAIPPQNESILDTWLDTATYALIGLIVQKGIWGK